METFLGFFLGGGVMFPSAIGLGISTTSPSMLLKAPMLVSAALPVPTFFSCGGDGGRALNIGGVGCCFCCCGG